MLYSNGYGTTSIYGKVFVDEHFAVRHDRPGMLSMANAGPNTNGCQFFITTAPAPHLDGRHVAFGQVVVGYDIVKEIEALGSSDGRPRAQVYITDSGELNEAGYLAEVAYERTRLRAKIEVERERDVEELRIYNECLRSGIDYVPRPVREKYLRDVTMAEERQKEAEDFATSSVRQALSSNVEMLTKKVEAIEEEALDDLKSRGAQVSASKLKKRSSSISSTSTTLAGTNTSELTRDILSAIMSSKNGQLTLVESLQASAQSGGKKKGSSPSSRLARFTEQLLAKAPLGIEPFWPKIDALLQHSARTPAPLTPELIMTQIHHLRDVAREVLEEESVQILENQGAEALAKMKAESENASKKDTDYAAVLNILQRHPRAHALSPQLNTSQAETASALMEEIEYLVQFIPSSPTQLPLAPANMPDKTQIGALLHKKHALEDMLKPFASVGSAMPFDATSHTFEKPKASERSKKIIKY